MFGVGINSMNLLVSTCFASVTNGNFTFCSVSLYMESLFNRAVCEVDKNDFAHFFPFPRKKNWINTHSSYKNAHCATALILNSNIGIFWGRLWIHTCTNVYILKWMSRICRHCQHNSVMKVISTSKRRGKWMFKRKTSNMSSSLKNHLVFRLNNNSFLLEINLKDIEIDEKIFFHRNWDPNPNFG